MKTWQKVGIGAVAVVVCVAGLGGLVSKTNPQKSIPPAAVADKTVVATSDNRLVQLMLQSLGTDKVAAGVMKMVAANGVITVEQLTQLTDRFEELVGHQITDTDIAALKAAVDDYGKSVQDAKATADALQKLVDQLSTKPANTSQADPPASATTTQQAALPPPAATTSSPPTPQQGAGTAADTPPLAPNDVAGQGIVKDGNGGAWWRGVFYSSCQEAQRIAIPEGLGDPCESPVMTSDLRPFDQVFQN